MSKNYFTITFVVAVMTVVSLTSLVTPRIAPLMSAVSLTSDLKVTSVVALPSFVDVKSVLTFSRVVTVRSDVTLTNVVTPIGIVIVAIVLSLTNIVALTSVMAVRSLVLQTSVVADDVTAGDTNEFCNSRRCCHCDKRLVLSNVVSETSAVILTNV